ncbi:GNAT family N-acetyltransferase [Halorubellus sp. JP-L1]|uniref:GNAT family N-acetyltransferase n=1 Tax=Halorubellus sp. JP-L1 TaxID=2715753 RepID=UPI00140851BD|nr:GNAT family protein [Halorubellus sp. JP-L1]NHN40886.1 GNAT family N-acetyltransferase [Halorubellus sp. JP-L1]
MPGHIFLEGTDVVLRVIEQCDRDFDVLGRVRNEPTFRHDLRIDGPWTRSSVREFVESVAADDSSVNLFVCPCGEERHRDGRETARTTAEGATADSGPETPIAGAVNLFDVDGTSGTLSYWLFEAYRGTGYATEAVSLLLDHAFDERGLRRVEAEVVDGNDASERLLDRLGFDHEGTARDARFARAEFVDAHRFGLLAPEWSGAGAA